VLDLGFSLSLSVGGIAVCLAGGAMGGIVWQLRTR
jgi:hypothetical protein